MALSDGWTDDQREAVKEFCKISCETLFLSESRGEVLEAINQMLKVSGMAYLEGFPDEDELGEMLEPFQNGKLWEG